MKNDPRRSFWRAAGPLLGFWGIQLVMEFVIVFGGYQCGCHASVCE